MKRQIIRPYPNLADFLLSTHAMVRCLSVKCDFILEKKILYPSRTGHRSECFVNVEVNREPSISGKVPGYFIIRVC